MALAFVEERGKRGSSAKSLAGDKRWKMVHESRENNPKEEQILGSGFRYKKPSLTPTFPTEKGKWEQDCYNSSETTSLSCCSCLCWVEEGEPISWNWGLWTSMPHILPPRLLGGPIYLLLQVEPTEQWACSHWGPLLGRHYLARCFFHLSGSAALKD